MSSKLEHIIAEFADLEPRERLELLLDFSDGLPKLPARLQAEKDTGFNRVLECQTPVFLWVERDEGVLHIYADVAPEAPTVKGFVAILVDALSGAPAEEVADVEPNLVSRLGLVEALGMVRMRGLNGILLRIRQEARRAVNTAG